MKYILIALVASALGLSTISTYAENKKTGSERDVVVLKDSKGSLYAIDRGRCHESKSTGFHICF